MANPPQWFSTLLRWLISKAQRLIGIASEMPKSPVAPVVIIQPVAIDSKAYATVVIPALNEEKRISEVVAYALADPATTEVIVIDDNSIDRTAELARLAGAKVFTSSMLGKGASMHDGIAPAQCNLLVYLDGDLTGLRSGIITDLCAPLLRGETPFCKGALWSWGWSCHRIDGQTDVEDILPGIGAFLPALRWNHRSKKIFTASTDLRGWIRRGRGFVVGRTPSWRQAGRS